MLCVIMSLKYIVFHVGLLIRLINTIVADKPCAVRRIPSQSVVCVCNITYCDEITREVPDDGSFVAYTSSAKGLRFSKINGKLGKITKSATFELDPSEGFQRIEGFGGAVTDSTGINWKSLPNILQDALVNSYFSSNGLEYNMIRVPIGASDFSTHPYSYNDQPENDVNLSNFSLVYEDFQYKIPMIKSMMAVSTSPVHIIGTTWSPPVWMKTNNKFSGRSRLKRLYYQTYADYHLKFLEAYQENGIPIWGITTTNEPSVSSISRSNTLGWSIDGMGEWIESYLGPTIRNSTFRDVKIIAGDEHRLVLPVWISIMFLKHPKAAKYIDGIGLHYYLNKFIPASVLNPISRLHPELFLISTEASEGAFFWERKVQVGSWNRARNYIVDILETLNHNVVGWIDWNMCLDMNGGPNWATIAVDSSILVDADSQEFIKQPMFYALGHFSKFLPRDSLRIRVTEKGDVYQLPQVSFMTPRDTIVFIVYNKGAETTIVLNYNESQLSLELEPQSITTIEFKL